MSQVLLQLENSGCCVVDGAPTDEPVRIVISYAPNATSQTQQDAQSLHHELRTSLRALGCTEKIPACGGKYLGTGNCLTDRAAQREHNILVVVEDPTVHYPPSIAASLLGLPEAQIKPASRRNTRAAASGAFARHIMLFYDPPAIGALAPDILEAAGLGGDGFRIFISYRHADSAAVANQIFNGGTLRGISRSPPRLAGAGLCRPDHG